MAKPSRHTITVATHHALTSMVAVWLLVTLLVLYRVRQFGLAFPDQGLPIAYRVQMLATVGLLVAFSLAAVWSWMKRPAAACRKRRG
ncbi:MAG: hypothetical protein WD294_03615 [Phycisphaeraceae bacterium]